jgi:hypothetical protein
MWNAFANADKAFHNLAARPVHGAFEDYCAIRSGASRKEGGTRSLRHIENGKENRREPRRRGTERASIVHYFTDKVLFRNGHA